MSKYYKNWKRFLYEEKTIIPTREEMVSIIMADPEQERYIDFPKGSLKKFGQDIPMELEFDYGEWPEFINPADGMGWDFVIVPSADSGTPNLIPVGHVVYKPHYHKKVGNDKIIIAPKVGWESVEEDKKTINDFYGRMKRFDTPVWY